MTAAADKAMIELSDYCSAKLFLHCWHEAWARRAAHQQYRTLT